MEQHKPESPTSDDGSGAGSPDLVVRMREFARRVVNGEPTADLFGLGDSFINDVVGRAYKLYGAKNYDNAEVLLKGAIALDETRAYPHLLLGDILLHKSEYEEAMQQFERAHELNPEDGETMAKLGEANLRVGQVEAANRHLDAAMNMLPAESRHYRRARVLRDVTERNGRETKAVEPF